MLSTNHIRRYFSTLRDQYSAPSTPASTDDPRRETGLNGALTALRASSRGGLAGEGRPRAVLPKRLESGNPVTSTHQVRSGGFSDSDLAVTIRKLLVEAGVLSKNDLAKLISSPSEEAVRAIVGTNPTAAETAFDLYWQSLGAWLSERGSNVEALSGRNFVGRLGAHPDISTRAIYNDAFRDVRVHLGRDRFNVVKAIANHLRLAKLFS